MDIIYDFVESIHVFIPIIAVVFFILIVFLCGISRSQQPPDDYLDKLQQIGQHSVKPKKKLLAKQQHPLVQSKVQHLPSSLPASVPAPKPKSSSPEKSPESGLRQRKTKTKSGEGMKNRVNLTDNEFLEVVEPSSEDQDNGWVTVTPKRRPRPPRSQDSETDTHNDTTLYQRTETEAENIDKDWKTDDGNQTSSDDSPIKAAEPEPNVVEEDVGSEEPTEKKESQVTEATDKADEEWSTPKSKKTHKKQKSSKPAFEIEEPSVEENKEEEQPETEGTVDASGSSVEMGTDALETESNEQPPAPEKDNDSPEAEQPEDDGEWTTAGDKKKRKKKKKKDKKSGGEEPAQTFDDIDDDRLEPSPVDQSSPQVARRRRPRKE